MSMMLSDKAVLATRLLLRKLRKIKVVPDFLITGGNGEGGQSPLILNGLLGSLLAERAKAMSNSGDVNPSPAPTEK